MPKSSNGQAITASAVTNPKEHSAENSTDTSVLRVYEYHGLDFSSSGSNGKEVVAECPFCGKRKFHVEVSTGKFTCYTCPMEGNHSVFLRELHSQSMKATKDYSWIEEHRKLPKDALRAWGVCKSITTEDWIIPGFLTNGNIGNISKYLLLKDKAATQKEYYALVPTPTLAQCFFTHGPTFNFTKPELISCEGPWDGIALWNLLRDTKVTADNDYEITSNEQISLLNTRNVIAVPGANTFLDGWNKLTNEKHVTFCYDNDHPHTNSNNGHVSMVGFEGMRKASGIISTVEDSEKPKSIQYLDWSLLAGDTPKGYSESYPDGFDVRDLLAMKEREGLKELFSMFRAVPTSWTEGKSIKRGSSESKKIEGEKCDSWRKLVLAWKKAMKFTPELEGALAVCLSSIASVKYQGKGKLWVQLLSPASTGKTMLCEAMIYAHKYCIKESDMSGFYSGWAPDGAASKDSSLANRLWDKTMFTLEGDTILKSKFKDIILSQGRELFDGIGGKAYGNDIERDYRGLLFTWIMCGTNSLRELDTSELGQRFIRYCIMKEIDTSLEDEIATRAIFQEIEDCKVESNCKVESTMSPNYLKAIRLTIGYIDHLKRTTTEIVGRIPFPEEYMHQCVKYAKFISYIRARPSKTQDEGAERELAGRLPKQLGRLAQYLAVVLQKKEVDSQVMKIVHKVAIDTCDGRTLDIVKVLAKKHNEGLDLRGVASATKQSVHKESVYLDFLTKIKALEQFDLNLPSLAKNAYARWRLTEDFRVLYNSVMNTKQKKVSNKE